MGEENDDDLFASALGGVLTSRGEATDALSSARLQLVVRSLLTETVSALLWPTIVQAALDLDHDEEQEQESLLRVVDASDWRRGSAASSSSRSDVDEAVADDGSASGGEADDEGDGFSDDGGEEDEEEEREQEREHVEEAKDTRDTLLHEEPPPEEAVTVAAEEAVTAGAAAAAVAAAAADADAAAAAAAAASHSRRPRRTAVIVVEVEKHVPVVIDNARDYDDERFERRFRLESAKRCAEESSSKQAESDDDDSHFSEDELTDDEVVVLGNKEQEEEEDIKIVPLFSQKKPRRRRRRQSARSVVSSPGVEQEITTEIEVINGEWSRGDEALEALLRCKDARRVATSVVEAQLREGVLPPASMVRRIEKWMETTGEQSRFLATAVLLLSGCRAQCEIRNNKIVLSDGNCPVVVGAVPAPLDYTETELLGLVRLHGVDRDAGAQLAVRRQSPKILAAVLLLETRAHATATMLFDTLSEEKVNYWGPQRKKNAGVALAVLFSPGRHDPLCLALRKREALRKLYDPAKFNALFESLLGTVDHHLDDLLAETQAEMLAAHASPGHSSSSSTRSTSSAVSSSSSSSRNRSSSPRAARPEGTLAT